MKRRFGHIEFCLHCIGATPRTAQTRGAIYSIKTSENQPSERLHGRQSVNLKESRERLRDTLHSETEAVLTDEKNGVGDTIRPDALSDGTGIYSNESSI